MGRKALLVVQGCQGALGEPQRWPIRAAGLCAVWWERQEVRRRSGGLLVVLEKPSLGPWEQGGFERLGVGWAGCRQCISGLRSGEDPPPGTPRPVKSRVLARSEAWRVGLRVPVSDRVQVALLLMGRLGSGTTAPGFGLSGV